MLSVDRDVDRPVNEETPAIRSPEREAHGDLAKVRGNRRIGEASIRAQLDGSGIRVVQQGKRQRIPAIEVDYRQCRGQRKIVKTGKTRRAINRGRDIFLQHQDGHVSAVDHTGVVGWRGLRRRGDETQVDQAD
jgi:hypothetical protein